MQDFGYGYFIVYHDFMNVCAASNHHRSRNVLKEIIQSSVLFADFNFSLQRVRHVVEKLVAVALEKVLACQSFQAECARHV